MNERSVKLHYHVIFDFVKCLSKRDSPLFEITQVQKHAARKMDHSRLENMTLYAFIIIEKKIN